MSISQLLINNSYPLFCDSLTANTINVTSSSLGKAVYRNNPITELPATSSYLTLYQLPSLTRHSTSSQILLNVSTNVLCYAARIIQYTIFRISYDESGNILGAPVDISGGLGLGSYNTTGFLPVSLSFVDSVDNTLAKSVLYTFQAKGEDPSSWNYLETLVSFTATELSN